MESDIPNKARREYQMNFARERYPLLAIIASRLENVGHFFKFVLFHPPPPEL